MAHWDGQVDHIHLLRVEHFAPEPRLTADQMLTENMHEFRWWAPDELIASDATFAPRAMPNMLMNLLASDLPAEPLTITGF